MEISFEVFDFTQNLSPSKKQFKESKKFTV